MLRNIPLSVGCLVRPPDTEWKPCFDTSNKPNLAKKQHYPGLINTLHSVQLYANSVWNLNVPGALFKGHPNKS